ncbi:MAG: Winged helix-turn-helix DNA-binding [Thermoplasmata archaeon]|nr:Winged helix-turn-helix DNA-binding [Thermoplasmata archaeon]
MDGTDFRIVGHLFQNPRAGVQELARAVGLTRNAVARRLRALVAGPMELRFYAIPHHALLGRASTVNLYLPTRAVDIAELVACPDVMGYDLNHDGLCVVTLWQRPGAARPPQLDAMMGAEPLSQYTDATPGPRHPHLSGLEWKVARALLDEPRASAAALAKATGLSPRTCSRARERLVASAAVQLRIGFSEDRSSGMPVFRAYVHGKPDDAAVQAVLGGEAVVTDVVAEGKVWFAKADSVGSMVADVERLRRLKGVADVKLILSRAAGVSHGNLRAWCAQAASSGRARAL